MIKAAKEHIELALSQVWLRQLETMEQNIFAMQASDDVEKLHQFRVALRQTRALLKLFSRYLPNANGHFSTEFKWLANSTSAVRDLDVQLLTYQDEAHNPDFTPILKEFSYKRQTAHASLKKILTGKRFRKIMVSWKDYISVKMLSDLPDKPKMSIQKIIKKTAARQCRRLCRDGQAIKRTSPALQLHRLRIRVKRFRYLLLNFGYIFDDKKQFRQLLKALESLQLVLGNHQDSVKANVCLKKILKSEIAKSFSIDTVCCARRWIATFTQQQNEAREQFGDTFKTFKRVRSAIE